MAACKDPTRPPDPSAGGCGPQAEASGVLAGSGPSAKGCGPQTGPAERTPITGSTAMSGDRDAIAGLICAYAERLDGGDFEALAQLFTHATLRSNHRPEPRRGSAQALELYTSTVALYDGTPHTKHVITNVVIDVDAASASATARSYFTVLQARPELPLQIIIAGRYHDHFARRNGTWWFADRLILVDLLGDLRFHLKRNPFPPRTEEPA